MSLKQQLKDLKKQKRQEVHHLHFTYLRTKRDMKRQASPARIVRKHLGASMGVAAVLGLLLAPRPSSKVSEREIEKAVKKYVKEGRPAAPDTSSLSARLQEIVHNALGSLQHLVPNPKAPSPATGNGHAAKAKAPKINSLLGSLLTVLVSRLDLTRLISELSKNVMAKTQGAPKTNGHSPSVSVADVGTVKPDQLEDFQ
jgi:hypothetical protein